MKKNIKKFLKVSNRRCCNSNDDYQLSTYNYKNS